MRLSALALLFVLAAAPAVAADTIPAADAAKHVGETGTVVGVLNGYHFGGQKKPTYWNIYGEYPNNSFTAVIFAEDVGKFPNVKPLIGKTLSITGTIQLHNGKPEIILKDVTQVQVQQ